MIIKMSDEQKQQQVMLSTEPGVILYPATAVTVCKDWKWLDEIQPADEQQQFLY